MRYEKQVSETRRQWRVQLTLSASSTEIFLSYQEKPPLKACWGSEFRLGYCINRIAPSLLAEPTDRSTDRRIPPLTILCHSAGLSALVYSSLSPGDGRPVLIKTLYGTQTLRLPTVAGSSLYGDSYQGCWRPEPFPRCFVVHKTRARSRSVV